MTQKLKLCGVPYKLEFVPGAEYVLTRGGEANEEGLCGAINYKNYTVRIDASRPVEEQRITLIHEIIHGVIKELSVRELIDPQSGEHMEIPIDQLAHGLAEALASLKLFLPTGEK